MTPQELFQRRKDSMDAANQEIIDQRTITQEADYRANRQLLFQRNLDRTGGVRSGTSRNPNEGFELYRLGILARKKPIEWGFSPPKAAAPAAPAAPTNQEGGNLKHNPDFFERIGQKGFDYMDPTKALNPVKKNRGSGLINRDKLPGFFRGLF